MATKQLSRPLGTRALRLIPGVDGLCPFVVDHVLAPAPFRTGRGIRSTVRSSNQLIIAGGFLCSTYAVTPETVSAIRQGQGQMHSRSRLGVVN